MLLALLIGEIIGLNSFVFRRVTVTMHLPSYSPLFLALLTLGIVGVVLRREEVGWSALTTLLIGLCTGYVASVLSYVLAPVLGGGFSTSMYMNAITFGGIAQYAMLAILLPFTLLGWLYGGLSAALACLVCHSFQRSS